jgi:putative colanic acid biosynthesis acetyltransferase WcaF
MDNNVVDLSSFKHSLHVNIWDKLRYLIWLILSNLFFLTNIPYPSRFKVGILRLMGARVGVSCVIKPWVKIKLPWKLRIGDHVWIGEAAWIDNISDVEIGNHVCISQNALLLTGNHDYASTSFDLMSKPINIEDGAWICANSTIVGGVSVASHSVVGIGQIITKNTLPFEVYGNGSTTLSKKRVIK